MKSTSHQFLTLIFIIIKINKQVIINAYMYTLHRYELCYDRYKLFIYFMYCHIKNIYKLNSHSHNKHLSLGNTECN